MRLSSRCIAVVLAGALTFAPPLAHAQIDNLPRLGDAGTRGYLDKVPTDAVVRYEADLLRHIRADKQALLADIRDQKDISKNGKDGRREDVEVATVLVEAGLAVDGVGE